MKNKIKEALSLLYSRGSVSGNLDWQSLEKTVQEHNRMLEVKNLYLKFPIPIDLVDEIKPSMPWAENHFQERIMGEPLNPGKEYKNWPHYKAIDNDKLFKGNGTFSHTYMERYWPDNLSGKRFRFGDLNDVIYKLKLNPYTRQAYLPVYWPEDNSVVFERVPCTLGYWFYYDEGLMNMTYHIRSCDAVRHFRNDIYMTYRLLQHVSEKLKISPGNLDMWIGSFHCFESDLYTVKKQIR